MRKCYEYLLVKSLTTVVVKLGLTMGLTIGTAPLLLAQQPVTPVRVSGWNVDGIAEGELPPGTTTSYAAATTTAPLDLPTGSGSVLYSKDFRGLVNQSNTPPYGLSEDGLLITNMNGYASTFRVRNFKDLNIGQLLRDDSLALDIVPYQPAESIHLLVFSSEGSSTVEVKPRFRSLTADTAFYQSEFVADWFNVDAKNALNRIGRVSRNNDVFSGTVTNPHLDLLEYTMSSRQRADYLSKVVVRKNLSASYFHVVGISVANSYDAPFISRARATSTTDFEVNYTSSVPNGSYVYEVASDSLFSNYLPAMQLATSTSNALQLTAPQTLAGDTVYFRVRVVDANGRGSAFTEPTMIILNTTSQAKPFAAVNGRVWPNPLKRGQSLSLPSDAELVTVTNSVGQVVSIQTMATGLYQVVYRIGQQHFIARLVVE